MKKVLILSAFLSVALLNAGGNGVAPAAAPVAEILTDCSKNTVFKDAEGLMWQDEAYTDAEDGAYKNNKASGKAGTLKHAKAYCSTLNYAGFTDWRLPTSDELMTVHRKPGQVFTNSRGFDFWTSTPSKAGKYYVVYAVDAYRYERKGTESNYIRCVRCTK
jgi:hypothetical protein